MSEPIKLSVAIVTRNRPESLTRCLQSWRAQTIQPFEIVVSDDSDEPISSEIESICNQYSCRYIHGPRRGLYANRNSAALACTGSHIATGDDDHAHLITYVETIMSCLSEDPNRVWTFGERHRLSDMISCPPELHRSGAGIHPADPSNSAAISDGASVYPREIFDSGLRYDETYRFGTIWYLWGQVLVKHGWRITFSEASFVWHFAHTENRLSDMAAVKEQLECMMYVSFVNAFWINPSLTNIFWSFAYLARRMVLTDSIVWYKVRTRIGLVQAMRLMYLALTYPLRVEKI
jgi:glycosyltransferase involved in cell wall biosynthesis